LAANASVDREHLVRRWTGRVATALAASVLIAPLVVLVLGGASRAWFFPDAWPDLTLDGFREVGGRPATVDALITGAVIGVAVTVLTLVVAWPTARVLARSSGPVVGVIFAVLLIPSVVPQVSLATGVTSLLLRFGWSGGQGSVVLAHLVPTIPYGVAVLTAVFVRHDDRIEQQARVLGASPWQVFWMVTRPMVWSGLAVAGVLCFLVSWSQYLLTLLVGEGQVVTITMLVATASAGGNPTTIGVTATLAAIPAVLAVVAAGSALVERE